jgi:hypothetical protein
MAALFGPEVERVGYSRCDSNKPTEVLPKNSYRLLKIAMTQHTRLRVGSDCGSKLPSLLLLVQIVTTILAEDVIQSDRCSDRSMFQSQTALSADRHIKRIIA